jgi:hypothetical protein
MMIKSEKSKRLLTTGQISGITRVGFRTLQIYVSTFPEFFGPGVAKRTRGRRWTQEDLELVQAIRCLYHERAGTRKIRELIAGGWRLENDQAWTRELMGRLIEKILEVYEDLKNSTQEVITLKRILEERQRDNKAFQELWIRQGDLEHEWEVMQKAWRLRTVITKAVKKKYHGQLPELYPPGKNKD